MNRIGRYIVVKRLAAGGMAEIFLAKLIGEAGFEKKVVIKKILPQWALDEDFIKMLVDEAKIAVQLNHPNIVAIHELAREGDQYYIAMEYMNGVDVRRLMQKAHATKKAVPLDVALFIATEVLEGLSYAHAKKDPQGHPMEIIHRDISPQNILVSFDGTVKITDFGIAKAASRTQETATGVLKGKFAYMSPEQANQEGVDARSDLFSAAIVLYELVTGERLFHHDSDLETLERVRRAEPKISPEALKKIPDRLKEILFKAIKKPREERFENAGQFREALVAFARHSEKTLRRERVAEYVESLFKEEIQRNQLNQHQGCVEGEAPTALPTEGAYPLHQIPKDRVRTWPLENSLRTGTTRAPMMDETALLQEATRTVMPVILASAKDPEVSSSVATSWKGPVVYIATAVVVAAILLAVLYPFHEEKTNNADKDRGISKTSKVTLDVKKVVAERLTPPEVPPPIRADQAIPVAVVEEARPLPAESETVPNVPPAVVSAKELENGYLSVQATPWGSVVVDGGSPRETPVRRIPLKPGSHTIRVNHPPTSESVSTKLEIAAGREIICFAKFGRGKGLRCGK